MSWIRCPENHLFNANLYDTCNICAENAKKGPYRPPAMLERKTSVLPPENPRPPQLDLSAPQAPVNARTGGTVRLDAATAEGDQRTVVNLPSRNADLKAALDAGEVLPAVGWLVIITGPGAGRDFRLVPGQNYVGRDKEMEVNLDFGPNSDPSVSHREHALIVYDIEANECYISDRTQSRNLPRLNGKSIRGATTLKAGDIIQVGDTRFLFVPLCGEGFSWANQVENEAP